MKHAKHFEIGERVEVQRTPSADWEPAEYADRAWTGHHGVMLPLGKERETESADGKLVLTRHLVVPSRRIRKAPR